MNNFIKKPILTALFLFLGAGAFAQGGPPAPPGEVHGGTEDYPGGGAPLGGGLAIMLSLGAVYGGKKIYQYWKSLDDAELED